MLESSLGSLAAATPRITHLTLLNVEVTDAVLHAFAKHCPALQHVALGRTENNAFGNFVSDDGLAALAGGCSGLRSLCLFRCYSCSDAGLRELVGQGRRLDSLVLHSCPQVRGGGVQGQGFFLVGEFAKFGEFFKKMGQNQVPNAKN